MNTFKHFLFTLALFSFSLEQICAMEPYASSSTTQSTSSSNQSENNFQTLPSDILLLICLHTINWDGRNYKEAFQEPLRLCLVSKSMRRFIHTKFFESALATQLYEKITDINNETKKPLVEKELEDYTIQANYANSNPQYQLGNALHWAAINNDMSFLESMLPKIKRHKMQHLFDDKQIVYGLDLKPIVAILHTTIPDNEKAELVSLCISAGWNEILPTLFTMPLETYVISYPLTSAVLARHVPCEEIQKLTQASFAYQHGSTLMRLLKEHHLCNNNCTFE